MGLLVFLGAWLLVALIVAVPVGKSLHRRTEGRSVIDAAPDQPSTGRDRAA